VWWRLEGNETSSRSSRPPYISAPYKSETVVLGCSHNHHNPLQELESQFDTIEGNARVSKLPSNIVSYSCCIRLLVFIVDCKPLPRDMPLCIQGCATRTHNLTRSPAGVPGKSNSVGPHSSDFTLLSRRRHAQGLGGVTTLMLFLTRAPGLVSPE
jgi:hypothetical protein